MTRLCRIAGLSHFTPHDLRHTFASLLLQAGENPKYVQQQLRHATLSMTTDLYGRRLRAIPIRGGVSALDSAGPVDSQVDRRGVRALTPRQHDGFPLADVAIGT
jgi:Phage integrase family